MVIADLRRLKYSEIRQDAREDGENPSLPRNCERTCIAARPRTRAGFQSKLLAREKRCKPLKAEPAGSSLGRWLEKAQVRRPVFGALPACVPRGTKEPA